MTQEINKKAIISIAENRTLAIFNSDEERNWSEPFAFIQAADTQFGMIESYIEKKEIPNWDEEIRLTKLAVKAANAMSPKPKFFIVCGDLVDAMPGTATKDPQIQSFKSSFDELDPDIPLVCCCGNHDIGNTPTHQSIADYKKQFGDDYFSFWSGGVKFLVLNSQFYTDCTLVEDLAQLHDEWLDKQLTDSLVEKPKHLVVFQHIPWFLQYPEEEKAYFNIAKELRMKMLKKFKAAGVAVIFCGHYHRNAGGFYENMELVVTSAIGAQLGKDKSGLRVVRVLENKIDHEYYDLENIPKKIDL